MLKLKIILNDLTLHVRTLHVLSMNIKSILLVGVLSLLTACNVSNETPKQPSAKERVQIAKAKFEEHCKSAGEKIHKTVDGVEGVFLMKLRPEKANFDNQFVMDDPYGHDSGGEQYIQSFLRVLIHAPQFRPTIAGAPPRNGYLYVEAIDPQDGKRYRYTGTWKDVLRTSNIMNGGDGKTQFYSNEFVLDKTSAKSPAPRYGVNYDDLSTREDREYWIAGSSLRVIDLQTNEVIAERVGYMWDPAQGNTSGGRSPWLLAADYACPDFQRNKLRPPHDGPAQQLGQTEDFVEKILIPKIGP